MQTPQDQAVRRRTFAALVALGVAALLVVAGCEDRFTAFEPTEQDLIVYGYLNASADTQWIRVAPLRTTVTANPEFTAAVTLEELGGDRVIALRDSLFSYRPNQQVSEDLTYLHNHWTTERIEPGSSYRLSVRRPDAPLAEAMVKIPAPYDVEVWAADDGWRPDTVRLAPLRHIGYAVVTTYFYDACGSGLDRRHFPVSSLDSDVQLIPIDRIFTDRSRDCGRPVVEKRELWVAGSGQERPAGLETPSNVTNAVGFILGVLTRTVPYENCGFEGFQRDAQCRMRYDSAAAALGGTVRDPRCPDQGIARAHVQLRELDPEPAVLPAIRSTLSSRTGAYEFGGLQSGKRYLLSVRPTTSAEVPGWPIVAFGLYTDTLAFSPSERAMHDVEVMRQDQCGGEQ